MSDFLTCGNTGLVADEFCLLLVGVLAAELVATDEVATFKLDESLAPFGCETADLKQNKLLPISKHELHHKATVWY